MFYHCRAQEGREEDAVETFLSEDLGDIIAAIVRQRCSFLAAENRWHFNTENLFSDKKKRSFRSPVIEEELRGQIEHIWSREESIREVIVREMRNDPPHRVELEKFAVEIDNRCTTRFEEFEERVLDYLIQQTRFVESAFSVYPILMEGLTKARHKGRFFAQKWIRGAFRDSIVG